MEEPTRAQRALLDGLVEAGGLYAPVLEAQFAQCLTWNDEMCAECFYVKPTVGAPRLPAGSEKPMGFSATTTEGPDGAMVLLWHTGGVVDWVEISWVGEEHPPLERLRVDKE